MRKVKMLIAIVGLALFAGVAVAQELPQKHELEFQVPFLTVQGDPETIPPLPDSGGNPPDCAYCVTYYNCFYCGQPPAVVYFGTAYQCTNSCSTAGTEYCPAPGRIYIRWQDACANHSTNGVLQFSVRSIWQSPPPRETKTDYYSQQAPNKNQVDAWLSPFCWINGLGQHVYGVNVTTDWTKSY